MATKSKKINVQGKEISIILENEQEYISLTDMLKAKEGEFFHFRLASQQEYGRISGDLGKRL